MIDAGEPEIHVMLGVPSQVKLSEFSKRQDFIKFLSYRQTSDVIMSGGSNHIGDYINESGQNGTMNGFYIYPKDALKISSP
jgi:hypothetical protein